MAVNWGSFLSLSVLSAISLTGFVYYTTVFVFLEDWLGLNTSPGILNALIFSFFAFMALVSFSVSILTDPGSVPSFFAPETEDPQKDQGMQSRYCDKCCTYKPPRTHHCRVCKRCVLKMVIFTSCIIQKDHDFSRISFKLFYVLCGSITVVLSLSTSTLLGWHIYLLTHNMSTIVYREAVRAMWLARKSVQNYRHPYDLGAYNNLILILGPNVLKWLCPLAVDHLNGGTQFPVSND